MEPKDFSFEEDAVYELTHGDCWFLATLLHNLTGLPYTAIYGNGEIQHVGIELPNGNIVDIEGIWDVGDWESHWEYELQIWGIHIDNPTEDDPEYAEYLEAHDHSRDAVRYGTKTLGQIATEIAGMIEFPAVAV